MQIHGKHITTIISDLDGTLLGNGQKVPEEVFGMIAELEKRGVRFVVASGRQYNNVKLLFEPILYDIPFICENGSLIVEKEQTVFIKNIPREVSDELIDDLLAIPNAGTIVSSDRMQYTLGAKKEFLEFINAFAKPVYGVDDYHKLPKEANKISIWWETGQIGKEEEWLRRKYADRLQVVDSGNGWLDFTMKDTNKGTALRRLAELEGFSLEEALCFGDSENDVAMFRACGISYAMATGREYVKAEADYICDNVIRKLQEFLQEK